MAISDISISCAQENRRAGIKRIFAMQRTNITSFANSAAAYHQYDSVIVSDTTDGWYEIGVDDESAGFNAEGNSENGSSVFPVSFEARIPKLDRTTAKSLMGYVESCKIVLIVETYNKSASGSNNQAFVLGWDDLLKQDAALKVAVNETLEPALEGLNAYTFRATGKSAELRREYTGSIEDEDGNVFSFA